MESIKFNIPFYAGPENKYLEEVINSKLFAGNGKFTRLCQAFLEEKFRYKKVLLTTSCTDALEMCALLSNIQEGDEVIMPGYTFVSTANPFILRGAKVIFIDSSEDHPGMDVALIKNKITHKTKAIVVVHYAGIAIDMDIVMQIANENNLIVIEDAAQAINSTYKGRFLGSFGHLAALSFHETKNIQCGEGGALIINDERFVSRSEIIWEKGTNRSSFYRGEVNKYGWIDVGSSFLPSEITAAFLYAQLQVIEEVTSIRKDIWDTYYKLLMEMGLGSYLTLPHPPDNCKHNAHIFYLICNSLEERTKLILHLRNCSIGAVFHYQNLQESDFFKKFNNSCQLLPYANRYADCLLRLPLHPYLNETDITFICESIASFYELSYRD